jgi:hypothetical protein
MNYLALLFCWLVLALVLILLLRHYAQEWLADNDVMYPVYPWFVRLDHWLYHREAARVQHFVFEQHRFFGARVRVLGEFIHSI